MGEKARFLPRSKIDKAIKKIEKLYHTKMVNRGKPGGKPGTDHGFLHGWPLPLNHGLSVILH